MRTLVKILSKFLEAEGCKGYRKLNHRKCILKATVYIIILIEVIFNELSFPDAALGMIHQ